MLNNGKPGDCCDVCPPVRNRYFYGKLLDVFHFDLEQSYFNSKRQLLNRLISGYGVICGMNVQLGGDQQSIIVTPGIAIDKCGHEVMICEPSVPVQLPAPPPAPNPPPAANPVGPNVPGTNLGPSNPPAPAANSGPAPGTDGWDCGKFLRVSLCYQECPSDPVPTMGGDCDEHPACSPGSIRESYRIEVCPGKFQPARTTSRIADVIAGGTVNYAALVNYVTNMNCASPCPVRCLPLANIRIPDPGQTYDPNKSIDLSIRPICYTNDLLYQMILAMQPGQSQALAGKP